MYGLDFEQEEILYCLSIQIVRQSYRMEFSTKKKIFLLGQNNLLENPRGKPQEICQIPSIPSNPENHLQPTPPVLDRFFSAWEHPTVCCNPSLGLAVASCVLAMICFLAFLLPQLSLKFKELKIHALKRFQKKM